MSYDLYLKPAEGEFTREAFFRYFEGREHYKLNDSQAWYQNEDTGVCFLFEYQDESDLDPEEVAEGLVYHPVLLNINYIRPSYFALEAEPEITSFIKANSLKVFDPQKFESGLRDYSTSEFYEGYRDGNEYSYAIAVEKNMEVSTFPQEQGRAVWEWNYDVNSLQKTLGEEIFVPKIMFATYQGVVKTAVVWGDGICELIPEVDLLLIVRADLAPRRFFRKTQDVAIVPWQQFQPLLDQFKTKRLDGAYYMSYPAAPEPLLKAIKNLKPSPAKPEIIPVDQVLDREVLEQLRERKNAYLNKPNQ